MGKERLSRRDILKFGLGVGAAGLAPSSGYLLASSQFSPFFENPLSNKNAEYVERHGVYISGEDKIFEVDKHRIQAKVNELAFIDILNFLARENGVTDQTQSFLEEYPLRIHLHKSLLSIMVEYVPADITKNPEIRFPTPYLVDYLRWQYVNNKEMLKRQERIIYHELQHLVQDSIPNFLAYSNSQTLGLIGASGAFFYQLPTLVAKNKIPSELEEREKFLRRLGNFRRAGAIVGLPTGLALAQITAPAEREARDKEKISNSPGLAKYTGNFFSFEKD